jgi:hypothetical protein
MEKRGTTYHAHIVTSTAVGLGGPDITVMAVTDETTGAEDYILTIPLNADVGLDDAVRVLDEHGWQVAGEVGEDGEVEETRELSPFGDTRDAGYVIVEVQPADWELIVRDVTFAHAKAGAEKMRQDAALRHVHAGRADDAEEN